MMFKRPSFNFKRLLYTPAGKILISVIFGLGLAALFYKACDDKSCLVFQGPIISDMDGKITQYGDGECYQNEVIQTKCDPNKQQLDISKEAPTVLPAAAATGTAAAAKDDIVNGIFNFFSHSGSSTATSASTSTPTSPLGIPSPVSSASP
jgi:hypothetical protein